MTIVGLNAGFAAATGALNARLDPYTGFDFLVEIEGLLVGGFSEVTGLQVETEVEEYAEGGRNDFVHRLPGRTRYPSNLVLRRGLTDIDALWSWHREVALGRIERRNGTIYLLDRQRVPAMWWDFQDAFPVKWSGPDLRSDSNTVAVETVELVHRGISRPTESIGLSRARGVASIASRLF
ncbi:MAG: phage tail protein [Gemmatimonadetes bacterium]|nr:phage tail protein [Gemmatimonadota bacterium]